MTERPGRVPFVPPVHYLRDDGVECCIHATPVGPDSCRACHALVDDSIPPLFSGPQWETRDPEAEEIERDIQREA
jgi:hypothetical protein